MKHKKKKILFIELPQLCVAENALIEHVRLAETYLSWAILKSEATSFFDLFFLPEEDYKLANRPLIKRIKQIAPDIIISTLYLWNIERTVFILKELKKVLPALLTIAGGPEVAEEHPILWQAKCFDYMVIGEGEVVLPALLHSIGCGLAAPDYKNIIKLNADGRYLGGKKTLDEPPFIELLPDCRYKNYRISSEGIAYMELTRGCPLRCSFCRYNQLRKKMAMLPVEQALVRFRQLIDRGAKEIRFIDPTLTAYRYFKDFLKNAYLYAKQNKKRLKIFAELNAAHIDEKLAYLMKKAGFSEVEVGLQSIGDKVLKSVNRPTNLKKLKAGIKAMIKAKIKVIIDVMIGLPFQTKHEVLKSIRWASSIKGANVQALHTLLIPGTELRKKRFLYGMHSEPYPPYRILHTSWLNKKDIFDVYKKLRDRIGEQSEFPTSKFVGYSLKDLFSERINLKVSTDPENIDKAIKKILRGNSTHRAVIFEGNNLFQKRSIIKDIMVKSIAAEQHIFWQFVLSPMIEEPLDLFDYLILGLKQTSKKLGHINDRWIEFDTSGKICSRKLMVILKKNGIYSKEWQAAVENLLAKNFY